MAEETHSSACRAFCAGICMNILKVVGVSVLVIVGFVVGVLAEAVVELWRVILPCLVVMALLWLWMHGMHRPNSGPYHADPVPGRIMR